MVTYRPRGARGMPRQGVPRDMDQMRGSRREYDMYSPPLRAGPPRRRPNYDDELISKTLHVDQKRFYIDLKENGFGKFIKIIESNQNRGSGRNRVIIPQELFQEFIDVLTQYVDILEKDSNDTGENGPADSSERIETQKITNERKTLYIDLRKNNRGKFLKVTEQSPRNGEERTQVIVPSEGLEVLRDVIGEILRVASPPQRSRERDPRERDPRERDPRERDPRERDPRDPRDQRGNRRDIRDNRPEPREGRDPRDYRGDRRGEREYREPPRERREPREYRERNKRPRREVENGTAPPPAEATEGGDSDPKPKPAISNPTVNPGNHEETESSSIDETLPATIEVRSKRKRFYFDARRNEMGVFLQVSEVTRRRRRHINIPHVSWQSCQRALETMLEQLPYEAPEEVPVVSEEPDPLLEEAKDEPPSSDPQPNPVDKPEDSKTESS
ncbi:hypothetical protein LOD99_6835 [Oopsacas minuta]|uniref:Uncharacterized protein n=1 Tax=Oopsacas minuta TaxID=111878 RepID=A0AAV7JKS9_9METZ|nr:hypothetical protein LOD99_6835 [Oopsacas minuta]